MLEHPILINRPVVVTPSGVKLCRPSEAVLDILAGPQRGAFVKEDGGPWSTRPEPTDVEGSLCMSQSAAAMPPGLPLLRSASSNAT